MTTKLEVLDRLLITYPATFNGVDINYWYWDTDAGYFFLLETTATSHMISLSAIEEGIVVKGVYFQVESNLFCFYKKIDITADFAATGGLS